MTGIERKEGQKRKGRDAKEERITERKGNQGGEKLRQEKNTGRNPSFCQIICCF